MSHLKTEPSNNPIVLDPTEARHYTEVRRSGRVPEAQRRRLKALAYVQTSRIFRGTEVRQRIPVAETTRTSAWKGSSVQLSTRTSTSHLLHSSLPEARRLNARRREVRQGGAEGGLCGGSVIGADRPSLEQDTFVFCQDDVAGRLHFLKASVRRISREQKTTPDTGALFLVDRWAID